MRRRAGLRLGLARRPLLLGGAAADRGAGGGMDAARGARARDGARPHRHPRNLQLVPEPRAPREDGSDGGRALERTFDPRHRRRLVRAGVPGVRLRLPRREDAAGTARRVAPAPEAPVDDGSPVLRRPLLSAARGLVRAATRAEAVPADPDRRWPGGRAPPLWPAPPPPP